MVGLSLSLCIKDIIEGRVNEIECSLIIADTKADNAVDMHNLLTRYQETYWKANPEEARLIARRLLKAGKLIQPRTLGRHEEHNIAYGHWVVTNGNYLLDRHTMELLAMCNRCKHWGPLGFDCEFCEYMDEGASMRNCITCLLPKTCDCLCSTCTMARNQVAADYLTGWTESDEAIRNSLPGAMSRSQGNTDWDRGWNARIDKQEDK